MWSLQSGSFRVRLPRCVCVCVHIHIQRHRDKVTGRPIWPSLGSQKLHFCSIAFIKAVIKSPPSFLQHCIHQGSHKVHGKGKLTLALNREWQGSWRVYETRTFLCLCMENTVCYIQSICIPSSVPSTSQILTHLMNWVFGHLSFFSDGRHCLCPTHVSLVLTISASTNSTSKCQNLTWELLLASGVCCVLACQMSWGINIHEEQPSANKWQELVYTFPAAPSVAGWGFNSESYVLPWSLEFCKGINSSGPQWQPAW